MSSVLGWYGPLIDLHKASSHIGDFVQLLVFVHRSVRVGYKSQKGAEQIRTDIQVGDDTKPYFGVSLWQKHMGSVVSEGDIIFLQNVKIAKFGDVVEARTVQWSSLLCLIHPYELLVSKGMEELISGCRVGITLKDKLRKVIKWVQQTKSSLYSIKFPSDQQIECLPKNWKVLEEGLSRDCFSLSEVSQLTTFCKAVVCASIGEIYPRVTTRSLTDSEKEKVFLSRRVYKTEDNDLVEDLICTGCQLCGSPMGSGFEQNAVPLTCSKSSTRLHAVCSIYRPLMLYLWDESDYMPVLIRNKAAEILFGNIKAEKVYSIYKERKLNQNYDARQKCKDKDNDLSVADNLKVTRGELSGSCPVDAFKSTQLKENQHRGIDMNFYEIWLIFLKMLLQQGKNSPLKFKIVVDPSLDMENGKFEIVSVSMPCFEMK
ncbi:hypothetical protein L6164_030503 [Bauhinia variegata]|uniref:Uncharacterized protein n=1 Tax=Bauhinia variegata TaxID=167791 RepID=A0ACB9LCI3_BAUVA|nr:hypothetical protein L6164_030503 [Bauhinia variegata]